MRQQVIGVLAFISLNVLMFWLISAGFRVLRDAGDPTTPAALRPSGFNAVAAWALAALLFWWIWL